MIVNMGGGRVGVYFKNKRKGERREGKQNDSEYGRGAGGCVLLK